MSYINEAIKANKAKLKRLLTYKHEINFILYCEQERILKLLHKEMGNSNDSKWLIQDFRRKIQYKPNETTKSEALQSILSNDK